ncbi:MAG: hypothetical protein GDA44_11335 [Prochloron sp. SP5CPC1]|nr:hypothetical protein [Candidatus Paraprochloron terpiosi SP5CPC1]
MNVNPTVEEIKEMIFRLPLQEVVVLIQDIEERLETLDIMQLAETGFKEWNDTEEDIYSSYQY